MKRDEFLQQFEGIVLPEAFDQRLLDQAAEMFGRWGKSSHLSDREHLFEAYGLAAKQDDSPEEEMQKTALRFICTRIMQAEFSRKDAADLIRNFNKIKYPGYQWVE
ncbi:MAG: hypothetical protein A4E49_01771 [Methanosaeta sp. PtaU1.Bin112]|nr:MAG: hypothetical protein A4E49_01771 [Methanosaeta sp. PtaU1.Bin112]